MGSEKARADKIRFAPRGTPQIDWNGRVDQVSFKTLSFGANFLCDGSWRLERLRQPRAGG